MFNWAKNLVAAGSMLLALSSRTLAEVTAFDHDETVWTVDFSPEGKQFVSGDDAGVIRFWDIATEKVLFTLKIPG